MFYVSFLVDIYILVVSMKIKMLKTCLLVYKLITVKTLLVITVSLTQTMA